MAQPCKEWRATAGAEALAPACPGEGLLKRGITQLAHATKSFNSTGIASSTNSSTGWHFKTEGKDGIFKQRETRAMQGKEERGRTTNAAGKAASTGWHFNSMLIQWGRRLMQVTEEGGRSTTDTAGKAARLDDTVRFADTALRIRPVLDTSCRHIPILRICFEGQVLIHV